MTLDRTLPGSTVRVVSVGGPDLVALKLMEMGMVPGAALRVIKSAPFGDPIQICIKDYHLALRRNEAKSVIVTASEA